VTELLAVFRSEVRRIFTVRPAFSVLVGALVIYAGLYPQPYLAEALRDIPIAITDQDGSTSSREFIRRLEATEAVAVAGLFADLAGAERAVYARDMHAILLIPAQFERDLLRGRPSPVALYADASYFLLYQRISAAVSAVARTLGAEVATARLVAAGSDVTVAGAAIDALPLTAVPLFNPQGGYATYLLPAAFVLILQQTLLMGVGLLGTLKDGAVSTADANRRGAASIVFGKTLAYLALHAALVPGYLVVLPYLYGLPRLGRLADILMFALPFVLAVSFMGLSAAALLRKPEIVQLVLVAFGLPFFFLAGFAWPESAIPPLVGAFAQLIPSTPAISGFVRIGQMGATLSDTVAQLANIWALVALYGTLAVLAEMRTRANAFSR
jgi:ABC-2 type transport system permease protein